MQLGTSAVSWSNGFTVSYAEFTQRSRSHLNRVSNTRGLETAGIALRGNLTTGPLDRFIGEVCKWGGYPGIAGRVRRDNRANHILRQFQLAITQINANAPAAALSAINGITQLGTPSFASKHLRFLAPDQCGVLDALVRDSLGEYSWDAAGYGSYCADLQALATHVNNLTVAQTNPLAPSTSPSRPSGNRWLPSDCDMVIFAKINQW